MQAACSKLRFGGMRMTWPACADRELRVAAAAEQGEHALAPREVRDAGAERLDGAGGLEPEQRRFAGRRGIVALPLHDVGPVHARRVHANQDAAWPGDRGFGFAGFEHLGAAETVEQLLLSRLRRWSCAAS